MLNLRFESLLPLNETPLMLDEPGGDCIPSCPLSTPSIYIGRPVSSCSMLVRPYLNGAPPAPPPPTPAPEALAAPGCKAWIGLPGLLEMGKFVLADGESESEGGGLLPNSSLVGLTFPAPEDLLSCSERGTVPPPYPS